MYLMRAFIILAIVGATAGAGYYFGHMRNEEVCYEEIKKEITRTQETLDLWKAKPPANSSITSMDAIDTKFKINRDAALTEWRSLIAS
jgi:hypothetical protein